MKKAAEPPKPSCLAKPGTNELNAVHDTIPPARISPGITASRCIHETLCLPMLGRSPTQRGADNDTTAATAAKIVISQNTASKRPASSPRAVLATSPITSSPMIGPTAKPPKTDSDR